MAEIPRPGIGTRIQVYWILDKKYYAGIITGYARYGKAREVSAANNQGEIVPHVNVSL